MYLKQRNTESMCAAVTVCSPPCAAITSLAY
nr:MAG TPA: hypothetical protein [Caudoviricetes sp.]